MEINAILAAEAAAAAAAESDIYMTYDRDAKRIDNRRQSHNDVKQRSRSLVRSFVAVSQYTGRGRCVDDAEQASDTGRPIKRSCPPVFIAALTASFSPTAFASVRIFRCSVFATKPFTSTEAEMKVRLPSGVA